ncbi:MAG: glycosyltransferase family 2 protein [Psychroflexus sp.]
MQISVVIPLLNESESIAELQKWIQTVMDKNNFSYEIIYIDDGSTDNSWEVIQKIATTSEFVKGIKFTKNYGKSQALHAGFLKVKGDVVITMDADLQDNPEEIPELYKMISEEGFDLISGWKKKRFDSVVFKNFPSKVFNRVARWTSGLKLHDFNCGLKAYRHDVVKDIDVYGEMHRYIPVLAKQAGFHKIGEKIVRHQARKYGKTKFGAERFINGFLDLVTLWFFSKFGKRPMHFFGALGVFMFIVGCCSAIWIGASKLYKLWNGLPNILVVDNPWFYIALTAMVIGVQLFLAGFLGELILKTKHSQKRYLIKEII